MDYYEACFNSQLGGGGGGYSRGIGQIFIGAPHQRGHGGIGSFLAGIFRKVLPLLSRGAKVVGKEALRTGMNVISDITTQNTPIKESFRKRVKESGENLKRKAEEKFDKLMEGSGYKRRRYLALTHSDGVTSAVRRRRLKKGKTKRKKCIKGGGKKKKKKRKSKIGTLKKNKRKKKKANRTTRDIFG